MKKTISAILFIFMLFSIMMLSGELPTATPIIQLLMHYTIWSGITAILGFSIYFLNTTEE